MTTQSLASIDLDRALRRALVTIGIAVLVFAPVCWFLGGWQTAALFAVGAVISALGLWEWRSLVAVVSAAFAADPANPPRRTAWVLLRFSLRLLLVGAALYVSLKCLHGSPYALIAGLLLAVAALSLQTLLQIRN